MDFTDRQYDVFRLFRDRWALVTAGTPDHFNTMTIAWGSMGSIWGPPFKARSVLTVYVSPARYTHEFMERSDFFTVSFFPEEYREDLSLLGSRSGRDGDKIALTRLTPEPTEQGIIFREAELNFICRKIYTHSFEKERVPRDIAEGIYSRIPPHTMFMGEIVDAVGREG